MRKNQSQSNLLTQVAYIAVSLCLLYTNAAFAWKPSSHVYLGKETLAEVTAGTNELTFYRVDYANKEKTSDVIGQYPVDETLVNILRNNRDSFYAGIVGPDAFPDLPTGQTRIHIPCPDDLNKVEANEGCPTGHNHSVISDHWLKHIWKSSFEDNQTNAVRAFAFGYLTHAAGDMFMHTFVNHFAGGPFSSLSDNGLRHFLIETYVGKKTPELTDEDYNIELDTSVQKFIYEKLTYAKSGSVLDKDLLIDVPLVDAEENAIFLLSVPRYFSTLKNTLDYQLNDYDTTIVEHNNKISGIQEDITACVNRALDNNLGNDCSPLLVIDLSISLGNAQLARDLYLTPRIVPMEYAREWSLDIEQGLYAWPAFSHEVLRAFVFSPDGLDKLALTEAWEDYKNNYFLKMLGIPDVVGDNAAFIDNIMDSIYTIETRRWVAELKESFVDRLIRLFTLNQHTLEDLESFVKSPEANIPRFVNQPPQIGDNDDVNSVAVSISELDSYMGITNDKFDTNKFAPAHNTLTMLKLMLLSDDGIAQLYKDLKCPTTQDCTLETDEDDTNAMLGFIRTLDGGNEWHNHGEKMWFAECDVYQLLFMKQIGEEDNIGENCEPPKPKLTSPTIFPIGNTFNAPVEITLAHDDIEANIYYTISFEDQPFEPSNDPSDSRSTLYKGSFVLSTPFTGAQPLVVRAKAFKNGFEQSDTVAETFIVNSEQNAPSFFPNNVDYFGSVNISLSADTGSTIFYTKNGETPTYLSSVYSQPIHFEPGEYILKAVSYRIGYAPSEVIEYRFRVFSANDEDLIPELRFNPAGSAITVDELEVSIFVDAENTDIYYTIGEGFAPTEPTMNDTLYTEPFTLGLGQYFIKAKAFDPDNPARVSISRQISFTIDQAVGITEDPVFDPPPGTYFNNIQITASAQTIPDNAGTPVIGYTTDGSEPVINIIPVFPTRKYNGNFINLFRTTIIKSQATQKFFSPSNVVRAEYNFKVATPEVLPEPAVYQNSVEIFLSSETDFAKLYYTLDGTEPTNESTEYVVRDELPIVLTESATLKVRGYKNGYFNSDVFSANYVVEQFTTPVITEQPLPQREYVGSNIRLMTAASGNPAPSFQWFKNDSLIEGARQPYLELTNIQLDDNAEYHVESSNDVGVVISNKVQVDVISLPQPPEITQQIQNLQLYVGDELRLSAVVESDIETAYQWYLNGQLLADETQSEFVIETVDLLHKGQYQFLASNRGGETLSDIASILVTDPNLVVNLPIEISPPEIISQPSAVDVTIGEQLQLSVAVNAVPQPTYLWFHEQSALPDQRDALLVIDGINHDRAGEYYVLIQNSNGSVVSTKARVTVKENGALENNPIENDQQMDAQDQTNQEAATNEQAEDKTNAEKTDNVGNEQGAEDNRQDSVESETQNNGDTQNSDTAEKTAKGATAPFQIYLMLALLTLLRLNGKNLFRMLFRS